MNINTEDDHDSAKVGVQEAEAIQSDQDDLGEVQNEDYRSTWGGQRTDLTIEPTVLERYYVLLRRIAITLIVINILCITTAGVMAGIFIFNGDFEYIILNDGTDALCILDPKTGAIKQYE